jgi:3-dehydroquinate synthetase
VRQAIEAKIRVVRDDEREQGARALLNLGHTVGHALEVHGGYVSLLHGEAVALGLVVELEATAALGWTPKPLVERTRKLLGALGLPYQIESSTLASAWQHVGSDKKRTGDAVRLPVVVDQGRARVDRVALTELRKAALLA